MSAIVVSSVVYFALALWCAHAGTPEQLTGEYTFLIAHALWGPPVLAGLLGATMSSAITSLVGAPRILVALIRDDVVPGAGWLAETDDDGEPRRALVATAVLVLPALLLRDLNAIAPLITLFFLIAYGVINVVVLVEASLRLQSYRPSLPIPRLVPLAGAAGCAFAMVIVHPSLSLVALGLVSAVYVAIVRRGLRGVEDSRSGLLAAVAEWAATRATELDAGSPRGWKPSLLVPLDEEADLDDTYELLCDMTRPEGAVKLLGVCDRAELEPFTERVQQMGRAFRDDGLFTTWSVLDSTALTSGLVAGLQALRSAFFRPNILFAELGHVGHSDDELVEIWSESRRLSVGMAVLAPGPRGAPGRGSLTLWLEHPGDDRPVAATLDEGGMHLAVLTALRLQRAWDVPLVVRVVTDASEGGAQAQAFVDDLVDLARFPRDTEAMVMIGALEACMDRAPRSDLDVLVLPPAPDLPLVRRMVALTGSACLLLGDAGSESALA